ncbi:MAG: type II toxin-antitoxin system VapC family toxin [Hydrogenophaga sp.]|nr:type II toxin-antitoxin system VapC family toxin [Hydrogenophaga sp.]
MKPIVIDASAAGAWVLPDGANDAAQALYLQAIEPNAPFHVPLLWSWEMGNMLVMGVTRNRLDAAQLDQAMALLAGLQVQADMPLSAHRQAQVARLALTHGLTFYDATYLELVLRLNGQLASQDKKLIAAAKSCGIVCLDF